MSKFVADLHLHSAYARATSRNLNFDTISQWAKYKGIGLLSSADFTHPVWWNETKEKLAPAKHAGFYQYNGTHFLLGTEISCIYSQGGKVRRIHCLLYFPEKKDVENFNDQLGRAANLRADGRPIVGMSAKALLELALSVNEKAIFIPAHAWTPWFSLYGSNSGFDSIDECFGDLSGYIYAIETGLSSDPAMNWRISELDNRSIVSFSDAHSAPKMSREVTVFDSDFSYDGLLKALKSTNESGADQQFVRLQTTRDKLSDLKYEGNSARSKRSLHKLDQPHPLEDGASKVAFTIEFFPEEGKYHYTGHRNCNVRHSPIETDKYGIICPNCKKKLTIGVMHRVQQLADKNRPQGFKTMGRTPFKRMVPLLEILAESLGQQVTSEKVLAEYRNLVSHFGSEMDVLLKVNESDLEKAASIYRIVEGIKKVRDGDIVVEPGFDGVFGKVKIWPDTPDEAQATPTKKPIKQAEGQAHLFD